MLDLTLIVDGLRSVWCLMLSDERRVEGGVRTVEMSWRSRSL